MRARSAEQFYLLHPRRWRGPANLPASKPAGVFKAGLHKLADLMPKQGRPKKGVQAKKGVQDDGLHWDAELVVAKNRYGDAAPIKLNWNPQTTTFSTPGAGAGFDGPF